VILTQEICTPTTPLVNVQSAVSLIFVPSLTGIYDSRHVFHLEAAALHLQPLQLRTFVVTLRAI
jgi:hypothetical protein